MMQPILSLLPLAVFLLSVLAVSPFVGKPPDQGRT
jgi:hypothetical protein